MKMEHLHLVQQLKRERVWLSQKRMAELFDKSVKTINEHIKNIYKEGELEESSTIRKLQIVQKEGKREVQREIAYYNLDAIISVGYRVKSKRGIWANRVLKEYIIKGTPVYDGNKRIGAYLFVLFLHKNGILYKRNGESKINDNALASLALLVATSASEQKDIIIKFIRSKLVED